MTGMQAVDGRVLAIIVKSTDSENGRMHDLNEEEVFGMIDANQRVGFISDPRIVTLNGQGAFHSSINRTR